MEKERKKGEISRVKRGDMRGVDLEGLGLGMNEEGVGEVVEGYELKEKEGGKGRRKLEG